MFNINSKKELGKVIIEKLALQNALSHVAEYGNFRLSRWKWKEVYGLLIGKLKRNELIVENAFPMTHGSAIFVEFKKEHYILAAQINDIIAEFDEFFVGWYHSHPGLGFFLSGTDTLTHLGFQDVNPYAIAIVFDHKEIEREKTAFKIFRLHHTWAGPSSKYYKVDYELKDLNEKSELEFIEEIYYRITYSLDKHEIKGVENYAKNNIKKWLKV